jgi:hypothetical protein
MMRSSRYETDNAGEIPTFQKKNMIFTDDPLSSRTDEDCQDTTVDLFLVNKVQPVSHFSLLISSLSLESVKLIGLLMCCCFLL